MPEVIWKRGPLLVRLRGAEARGPRRTVPQPGRRGAQVSATHTSPRGSFQNTDLPAMRFSDPRRQPNVPTVLALRGQPVPDLKEDQAGSGSRGPGR